MSKLNFASLSGRLIIILVVKIGSGQGSKGRKITGQPVGQKIFSGMNRWAWMLADLQVGGEAQLTSGQRWSALGLLGHNSERAAAACEDATRDLHGGDTTRSELGLEQYDAGEVGLRALVVNLVMRLASRWRRRRWRIGVHAVVLVVRVRRRRRRVLMERRGVRRRRMVMARELEELEIT